MKVKIDTRGLDEFQRKLKQLDGTHNVPLTELLTPAFLRQQTRFTSLPDFEQKATARGFKASTQAEWDSIPKHELDTFIAEHSRFHSWDEMMSEAGAGYMKRKLGL
ncbi:MAG: hypothetical protein M3R24_02940 [Chloroflexota bacterium]|nr:hypothetical protein [Chloroflexota bacterium]